MKIAIVIPTYNEKENISRLVSDIFDLGISELEIIAVDDNSPDGTGKLLDGIREKDKRVHVIHRAKKSGLGTAYLEGFQYSLVQGAEYIFAMDADFSHNPKMIPIYLDEIEQHDLVVGSRYISGGKITNWDVMRRFISYSGNLFARYILNMPVADMTTGFKCYRRKVIAYLKNKNISSIGYVFQIETIYHAYNNGFKVKEIPIQFSERRSGKSKFNSKIIWESFWKVAKLGLFRLKLTDYLAYLIVLAFVVTFSFLSFSRHDALKSFLNDLGTYDQVIWNTTHGHFFDNSANMLNVRNYLGSHFSPILLIFTPFYLIFPNPKWLLFFQSLAVGLGSFFIYLFAREHLKKGYIALVFLLSFLINPYLGNGILYDFHEIVLAVFFAAGAFYFLEKEKWTAFYIFAILLALSQEHLVLLVFMMGLYIFFIKMKKKIGLMTSLISLAYFFLVMTVFMPHFSSSANPALLSNTSSYPSRYAWLGNSFTEASKNIITHPFIIAKAIFSGQRLSYLVFLVVPVFSLAIYAWPIIVILPLVFINLLSIFPLTFSVFFYHSAVLIPFIYFSAILAFKRWFLGNSFMEKTFSIFILSFSLVFFYCFSLTPFSQNSVLSDYLPSQHAKKLALIKKIIPENSFLSVQNNIASHFSQRREIYRFPIKSEEADYVILDRYDPYAKDFEKYFDFEYGIQMKTAQWQEEINKLSNSPDFEIIFDDGQYLIFKNNKSI
jgi:dolichol-phosphate mannosyltransferase